MNYMKKQLAKYILYVGLPLFLLHFAGAAFEKIDTIETAMGNLQHAAGR